MLLVSPCFRVRQVRQFDWLQHVRFLGKAVSVFHFGVDVLSSRERTWQGLAPGQQCLSRGLLVYRHMNCCCGVSATEAFDRLAASLPETARSPEDLPNVTFPPPAKRKQVGGIISDLDPAFIHQQLHVDGA